MAGKQKIRRLTSNSKKGQFVLGKDAVISYVSVHTWEFDLSWFHWSSLRMSDGNAKRDENLFLSSTMTFLSLSGATMSSVLPHTCVGELISCRRFKENYRYLWRMTDGRASRCLRH